MFGPRHTIESVVTELVDGFEDESIILRPKEPTEADVEDFESMMRTALARYRRREIVLLTASTSAAVVSIVIALWQVVPHSDGQSPVDEPHMRWAVALVSCIVGALIGFISGVMARGRSIELKTYLRVLKLADPSTARRLVLRVGPKLRQRELVAGEIPNSGT